MTGLSNTVELRPFDRSEPDPRATEFVDAALLPRMTSVPKLSMTLEM
jgi:hypothetical protein